MVGTVKWFGANRGYGFISQMNGKDLFVHYSAIESQGFRCLESGDRVQYEVALGEDNRPEAIHVVKL